MATEGKERTRTSHILVEYMCRYEGEHNRMAPNNEWIIACGVLTIVI